MQQLQVAGIAHAVEYARGVDHLAMHGQPIGDAVAGDHQDGGLGHVKQFAAPVIETFRVMKKPLAHANLRQSREYLAQHVAERVFILGDAALPMRFKHQQPGDAAFGLHALAAPGAPLGCPLWTPFARK